MPERLPPAEAKVAITSAKPFRFDMGADCADMRQLRITEGGPTPLTLAILCDDGQWSMLLTDSASLGRFGKVPADASFLRDCGARSAAGNGSQLFAALFDPSIAAYLAASEPRELILQLATDALDIAWETAFDGRHVLGEKFRICRRIASASTTSAPTRPRPPRAAFGVAVVEVSGDLRQLAADAEEGRFQSAEVVHVKGPFALGRATHLDQATLASVLSDAAINAGLWVIDVDPATGPAAHRLFAAAILAAGGACLIVESADDLTRRQAHDAIFEALRSESSFAEAARRAREKSSRHSPDCSDLNLILYGDGRFRSGGRAGALQADDSVRQVTVLSHDLVDSTRHLGTMGAERYSGLLQAYHSRCAAIVHDEGGICDDPQGDDGIMCYFGFPIAHEDATVRALRAGLRIVAAVIELGVQVRVGVATGRVAIAAGQPVGVAIHLAARLQAAAEPGTTLIAESTRRLVKDRFQLRQVEAKAALKGIDGPGTAFVVMRERHEAAAEAEAHARQTPFVGRDAEIDLLQRHWAAARQGSLQCVMVSGEAGIGKSRLLQEFRKLLSARSFASIESRCAPEGASSAFHALTDVLRRVMQIDVAEQPDTSLARIRQGIRASLDVDEAIPLIADLLSVPTASGEPWVAHPAEKKRQLTLKVLLEWFKSAAQGEPICLVVEDIHWIDPSSHEFLCRLVSEAAGLPLMIVSTSRSEGNLCWAPEFAYSALKLEGLSPAAARSLIIGASRDMALPNDIVRMLSVKGDGIPLFLEESTRMAVDLGQDGMHGAAAALQFAVPTTIHDLLMARLDRLGPAKRTAQLGAALGREFGRSLLDAVREQCDFMTAATTLDSDLAALVDSGLLVAQPSRGSESRYSFKHALVRDTAYQSLWERDRAKLHHAIARVLAAGFAPLADLQPELVAYHFDAGGMPAEALRFWEEAAVRATSRSAHLEAISHINCGIASLERLRPSPERDRAELKFQLLLAARLIATEGYGATRVQSVYERASALSHVLDDKVAMMKVQLGLEGYHFMRADFDRAHAIAVDAAAMASESRNPMHKVQSAWALANLLFHQGDIRTAVERMDFCLREYDQLEHRLAVVQDPGVMCLCYSAWGKWELGCADEALERAKRVTSLAEHRDHKFSMGEAFGFRTTVHYFRGEFTEALACADRAIAICEEGGFAVWLAHARLMRGRLVAESDPECGVAEMSEAFEGWSSTGAVVTRPFYLALRAEGLSLAGRPAEGLALLQEALNLVVECGERYYEAELRRLMGVLTLQLSDMTGEPRRQEAERWFSGALACANSQTLKALALRAATSLGRIWLADGRPHQALRILKSAYDEIDQGLDTRDLVEARRLIDECLASAAESSDQAVA